MKFSVLIPHFRTLKMTAFTVAQFLKYKGNHEIEIIVIDNSFPDESIKGLDPFKDQITILPNTSNLISSHGVALDMAMEIATNEWVITAESDSFPTKDCFFDYYARLINEGYDGAASILRLSGGTYGHPAGALYNRNIWKGAYMFCVNQPYYYYPNMAMKENFACHLMVHTSIVQEFLKNPDDYVELAEGYKPFDRFDAEKKRLHYYPVTLPMHNGMGGNEESVHTYGLRNEASEVPTILIPKEKKMFRRIGAEPGQFMYYYQLATNKKIFNIPTEIKWVPGREGQQQEYTLMENGFKHIWAGSAYLDMKESDPFMYEFKKKQIESLYE